MRSTPHSIVRHQFSTWLAVGLILAMLSQAMLPTLTLMRSSSTPSLWDEVCSVDGVRQNPQKPAPAYHAGCPLCLQAAHDVILHAPVVAVTSQLVLISFLSPLVPVRHFFFRLVAVPEARGPPQLI